MKSSLKNMVLMLFVIALVCSAAVAVVYKLTLEPIAVAQQNKAVEALRKALPEFDAIADTVEMDGCVVYPVVKDGSAVGCAVKTLSPNGFNGNVELMVGFRTDGTIHNIEVLSQAETPGLGANMATEGNALVVSFVGKVAADMNMAVKKDGGDVDALTAATISSRAYSEAVGFAYQAFKKYEAEEGANGGACEECASEGLVVLEGSARGFNGPVVLKVSFDKDSTIVDVEVVEQRETPSLGGVMTQEDNVLLKSVKGKRASELNLSISTMGGDIDVITGATISSRAYTKALEEAYEAYKKVNL